jgi:riboflavin synthase
MFTGIISHLGTIKNKHDTFIEIAAPVAFCNKLQKGTSVAVNGVCLTVLKKPKSNIFTVEVMPETLQRTVLGNISLNDLLNLELPITAESFLSGHIVQGHIDGTGKIQNISEDGNSALVTITCPKQLSKYIIEKGSVAINGVSLTIIEVTNESFTVGIIPFTWEHTIFHTLEIGDSVNIETDIFAKYVEKLINI